MLYSHLEKVLKLASQAYPDAEPQIAYRNGKFHYSCLFDMFTANSLEEIEEHIEKGLYNAWRNNVLNPAPTETKNVSAKNPMKLPIQEKNATATRYEWSIGKQGDPRTKPKNGKKFAHTKTQILGFMRKATNGRFSSEKITYQEYVKEFRHENKKAIGRDAWHTRYKKKYANKNKVTSVES